MVAFVLDDPYKADDARAVLNRMGGEVWLEIDETAVIVKKADGKVRVSQLLESDLPPDLERSILNEMQEAAIQAAPAKK